MEDSYFSAMYSHGRFYNDRNEFNVNNYYFSLLYFSFLITHTFQEEKLQFATLKFPSITKK